MLRTAHEHYLRQQDLTRRAAALAIRRSKGHPLGATLAALTSLQRQAAQQSAAATSAMLAEQSISAPAVAVVQPSALAGVTSAGAPLASLVTAVETVEDLVDVFRTQVADAGRIASSVALVARPKVAGYVRYLDPPSCARCTILAGRWYRWSTGFLRHEGCDCVMLPTTARPGRGLLATPDEAYRAGLVTGLTKAEQWALDHGADLAQVVNVRRKKAGLRVAGRVLHRRGRPTPEAIYQLATDRDNAISLLIRFGYLR